MLECRVCHKIHEFYEDFEKCCREESIFLKKNICEKDGHKYVASDNSQLRVCSVCMKYEDHKCKIKWENRYLTFSHGRCRLCGQSHWKDHKFMSFIYRKYRKILKAVQHARI